MATVLCYRCGQIIGETDIQAVDGEIHGICDKCLNLLLPHHADLIRAILDVEKVEEIFIGG